MSSIGAASLHTRERRVLEQFVELLREELGDDLEAVWLFGSRARGQPLSDDSDVDLLVITRGGRAKDLARVTRILTLASDAEGADSSAFAAHVMDPELLAERRRIESFFIQEVDRDKIVLFESG